MKTDSYFEIGSTHDICQDYALAGNINEHIAFAIVTDGCTQSHKICGQVDLGARVVAYAAREVLFELFKNVKQLFNDKTNENSVTSFNETVRHVLRIQTFNKYNEIRKTLNLNPMFSDCTLVVAITDGKITYTYMYGDGGIIVKLKSGETIYDDISYLSSAPYYLAYSHEKDRDNAYQIAYGASPVIHTRYTIPHNDDILSAKVEHEQAKSIDVGIYEFSSFTYTDISYIALTSDGIKSYQSMEGATTDIPPIQMAPKFVGFKNTNGSFVQRRMKALKKENDLAKISHYDDVSVASIVI